MQGVVPAAEARPGESFADNPGPWHPALTWSGWTWGTGGHSPEGSHTATAVLLGSQLQQGVGTLEKRPWTLITCFPPLLCTEMSQESLRHELTTHILQRMPPPKGGEERGGVVPEGSSETQSPLCQTLNLGGEWQGHIQIRSSL